MTLPYNGLRMIDFTQLEQGPAGTQVLADYGVDVIKVERMDIGEIGRRQQPQVNGMSYFWMSINRNKRCLSIDIRKPEGRDIIYRLVKDADIVASNFRPNVMERLGFGYETLKAINPRIIWAAASGYGMTGPYEKRGGQDLLAQAMGGLAAMTGDRNGLPTITGTWIADYLGAMLFAQGIMAALAAREQTGEGQVVESSLLNAMIASHIQENSAVLNAGTKFERTKHGVGHPNSGPTYALYECKDGKWWALNAGSGVRTDPLENLFAALDVDPSLASDDRFRERRMPEEAADALRGILVEAFKKYTRDEIEQRFDKHNIPPGPVYELDEMFEDPQVIHNDMVVEMEHEAYGNIKVTGFPVKLSETPPTVRSASATVGQHNEEVLREFGYSDEEIGALQDADIVGSENVKRAQSGAAD